MSRSEAAARRRRRPAGDRHDPAPERLEVVGPVSGRVLRVLRHPLSDYGLLLGATVTLMILGLIMVMSASTIYSLEEFKSSYALFGRQLLFAAVGFVLMMLASRMPVGFFRRMAYPALIVSAALLILVLVPGIGVEANGQQNWLSLGGTFMLQPSEIAKLALVVWMADLLARRHERVDGWRSLLMPLLPVSGILVALIVMEGDVGTTLVIMPVVALVLLMAGAPLRLFGWLGVGAGGLVGLMSLMAPFRLRRFQSWLDPQQDPTGVGWQVIRGQYALATGGWWGVGLGASREKWGFLPEAHTDFILAVIGEELGLVGTLSVIALFGVIAVVMTRIAVRSENMFVRLATAGVGIWIVVQALINIGAVLGALPITGLPLPLVSYGGSSLTFTLVAIGMVLAFARREPAAVEHLSQRKAARKPRRPRSRSTRR